MPLDKITKMKIDIFDGAFVVVVVVVVFSQIFYYHNFSFESLSTLRMFRSLAVQTLDEVKIKGKKKNYFVSFEKCD